MPTLDTTLHLDMLRAGKRRRRFERLRRVLNGLAPTETPYGLEWGDPDVVPPLVYIKGRFLLPYVTEQASVLEIGPGGGRWTRYLLGARRVYAVDFHPELIAEARTHMRSDRITFIRNNGDDFPGVPHASVDFLFSFGVFVHLDVDIIARYLENMRAVLAPAANVVLQYSDKTKPMARANEGFSENDPDTMRRLVESTGYEIVEEDTKTLWHSAVVRFRPALTR